MKIEARSRPPRGGRLAGVGEPFQLGEGEAVLDGRAVALLLDPAEVREGGVGLAAEREVEAEVATGVGLLVDVGGRGEQGVGAPRKIVDGPDARIPIRVVE